MLMIFEAGLQQRISMQISLTRKASAVFGGSCLCFSNLLFQVLGVISEKGLAERKHDKDA